MKKKPKSKLTDNEKNRKLNHTKPYTKCTKMSEEAAENLEVKNGISNGSISLSSKQHHQPQPFRMHQKSPEHPKSNEYQKQLQSSNNSNSNSNDNHVNGTKSSSNVGGRLQFFKDGKFILELARSREGEKQGWISVPRKTFWPPTITANSSKTFSKHESSTSLSYSDDNSSVQSSPWQRDHCWKQTQPRQNISVEMSFFFHKPAILLFSKESIETMQLKRRRPQDKSIGVYKVILANSGGSKNSTKKNDPNEQTVQEDSSCSKDDKNDAAQENNLVGESKKDTSILSKRTKKLESILKTLADRRLQANSPPYNKSNNGNTPSHNISNYSILSHLQQNTLSHNNLHQHVSPRKRILREFEKVSLEDSVMKRSKQKQSQQVTATTVQASIPNQRFLNNFSNGNDISTTNHTQNVSAAIGTTIASKQQPPTPISRPISSYSITSLLGHNNNKKSGTDDSILDKHTLNSNSKDSAYPSHCQRYSKEYDCAQQRISLITPQSSPIYTQADHKLKPIGDDKLKANNNFSIFASSSRVAAKTLNLSSSPEHHAFQKYRPSHETSNSPSSPYNYHHSAVAVTASSPSSSNDGSRGRGTSTGVYKSSPKRSFASTVVTSSSNLHETTSVLYKSRQSPQYKDNSRASSLSPSAMQLVPSKGTSLHRQSPCFSSPTAADAKMVSMVKDENALNLADLKQPRAKNALVRPTTPLSQLHHPTASHGMYYMYPPGYLQQSVSSYYHSFYNPPVAYRNPLYMQYPTHPSTAALYDENLNTTGSNPSMMNRLGYVPMSNPWNPIPLTTHSIDDGNLIDNKMKDESSTDLPLNLSKH